MSKVEIKEREEGDNSSCSVSDSSDADGRRVWVSDLKYKHED